MSPRTPPAPPSPSARGRWEHWPSNQTASRSAWKGTPWIERHPRGGRACSRLVKAKVGGRWPRPPALPSERGPGGDDAIVAGGSRGDDADADDASQSIEPDTFLRAVARAPHVSPQSGGPSGGVARSTEPDLTGLKLLHFHVVEQLGAGGMGVVYKAIDEKLRRPVALKVLSARLLADERHRETLLREARSAAAVNHPSIAAIYEVHERPEGAFFVMELVEGETLRERLARMGPLPVAEALRVALDIARGLARAHASNVVHRDLKCENVMLTRDGQVKLLDFGLATVQGDDGDPDDSHRVGAAEPTAALALAPTMPATPTPTTGGR